MISQAIATVLAFQELVLQFRFLQTLMQIIAKMSKVGTTHQMGELSHLSQHMIIVKKLSPSLIRSLELDLEVLALAKIIGR